jgi:hypothetical protein
MLIFLCDVKTKYWQCDWLAKKFAAKKLDQFLHFYCLHEQIPLVENRLNTLLVFFLPMQINSNCSCSLQ